MVKKNTLRGTAWSLFFGALLFSIIFLITTQSCHLTPEKEDEAEVGNVVVRIWDGVSMKTIVPDKDMEITKYILTGDGEQTWGPIELIKPVDQTIVTLKVGNYQVYCSGQNQYAEEIGYATESFEITAGNITEVGLTIVPISGTGDLHFNVSYTPIDIIMNPGVLSSLQPVNEAPVDIRQRGAG